MREVLKRYRAIIREVMGKKLEIERTCDDGREQNGKQKREENGRREERRVGEREDVRT